MSLTSLLLPLVASLWTSVPAPSGEPLVRWEAPTTYVEGLAFEVQVSIEAPEDGAEIASWLLTPAAFTVDGEALAERGEGGSLSLPAGFQVSGKIDLGPLLQGRTDFKLAYAGGKSQAAPVAVRAMQRAPAGLDFMTLPVEELAGYRVLLRTNRGDILVKLWDEVAPQHARNFLDLSYTGFYDGTRFHRVIEGFMIQGGDPTGTGTGSGPRTLQLEPSDRPHVRGVLSMARAQDPNSASCQFFIMHGAARHLDGQYSAFGEVVSGLEVVDAIATTPTQRQGAENSAPREPQLIEKAIRWRRLLDSGEVPSQAEMSTYTFEFLLTTATASSTHGWPMWAMMMVASGRSTATLST